MFEAARLDSAQWTPATPEWDPLMRFELSQRFFFEAAHTLRRKVDAAPSRRIHGHTYRASVTVGGPRDERSGMVVDLALLRAAIETLRLQLDHRLLDDVDGIGPATLENLCAYLMRGLQDPRWTVVRVEVAREASGDSCCLSAD